jgi:hypothetical protein
LKPGIVDLHSTTVAEWLEMIGTLTTVKGITANTTPPSEMHRPGYVQYLLKSYRWRLPSWFGIDNMRIIYNITTSLSTVFGMMRPLTAVVPTYIHQDKRFSRGCV